MSEKVNAVDEKQQKAYHKAVRMLAIREHSQAELKRKLGAFPADIVEQVLSRLKQHGYQSDERFVEVVVRSRIANGKGYLFIKQELSQHQIESELIERMLSSIDAQDWQEYCYDVWQKKFATSSLTVKVAEEDELEENTQNANKQKMKWRIKQQNFLNQRGFRPQDWKSFLP